MAKIIYKITTKQDAQNLEMPIVHKHPARNLVHHISRLALAKCLEFFEKKEVSHLLKLTEDYNSVQYFENYTCSLSHTKEDAIAVVARRDEITALGVDFEFLTREVPTRGEHHYINELDELTGLSPLEVWCIKEACFKAITGVYPECKLLKEVVITKDRFYFIKDPQDINSHYQKLIKGDKLIIFASITKNQSKVEVNCCEK